MITFSQKFLNCDKRKVYGLFKVLCDYKLMMQFKRPLIGLSNVAIASDLE